MVRQKICLWHQLKIRKKLSMHLPVVKIDLVFFFFRQLDPEFRERLSRTSLERKKPAHYNLVILSWSTRAGDLHQRILS